MKWRLQKLPPFTSRGCGGGGGGGGDDYGNNILTVYLLYLLSQRFFEKLIYDQINNFLVQTKVTSPHQSGFRAGHCTETSLLYTTNQCLVSMDKGLINGILFLDLKKAFATVSITKYLN